MKASDVVSSQFGLSLLYALLSQGERLLSSGIPLEPSIGDFATWYGPKRSPTLMLRPTSGRPDWG